jgi:carbonic anhydrase
MSVNRYNHTAAAMILAFFVMVAASSCHRKDRHDQQAGDKSNMLEKLMAGNYRFSHSRPVHPDEGKQRISEIAKGQHPFAVVISCSDSRVPPELIFDQGLGDLFVIRTAGNLMGGLEIGSVEYAAEHLNVPLIIVLGHRECGAIKAFVEGGEAGGHIKDIVDSIKAEKEISNIPPDDAKRLDHCIEANLRHATRQLLSQSVIIKEKA